MDFQDIIKALDRYWAKQGCSALPPGLAAGLRSLPRLPAQLALAGARAATGGEAALGGRYLYGLLFRPAPPDLRRLLLASFRAAGLEPAEHDLRWLASEGAGAAPERGWTLLLDGRPFAIFSYLPAGAATSAEVLVGLERLALAAQRRRSAAELAWGGRLSYGDLHPEGGPR